MGMLYLQESALHFPASHIVAYPNGKAHDAVGGLLQGAIDNAEGDIERGLEIRDALVVFWRGRVANQGRDTVILEASRRTGPPTFAAGTNAFAVM
jgi:hypothetical protein